MSVGRSRAPSQAQAQVDLIEVFEGKAEDQDDDKNGDVEETRASSTAAVAEQSTSTTVPPAVSLSRKIPAGTPIEEGKEKEIALQQGVPLGVMSDS